MLCHMNTHYPHKVSKFFEIRGLLYTGADPQYVPNFAVSVYSVALRGRKPPNFNAVLNSTFSDGAT